MAAGGRTDAAGGPVGRMKMEGLEWIGNRWNDAVHVAQQSVSKWAQGIQSMKLKNGGNRIAPKPEEGNGQVKFVAGRSLDKEMEAWRRNNSWTDETPVIQVKVPKGAFCEVHSQFHIGIPPDAVWNILIDPGNKRVFKNIQEVRSRKVLEDDGERQLVEVDQAAIWRFLWFSGTLSVCVLVDQDRRSHLMKYKLARPGFMKQFEGSWKVDPFYVDAQGNPALENAADRVASIVHLEQVVQPAMVPPPPFKSYVRGITTRTTEMLLQDLQAEGKRLRETSATGESLQASEASQKEELLDESSDHFKRSTGSRRKSRKSRWRLKEDPSP
ncbi:hypothetical protein M758_7G053700 [Ceratodon purpureus]|nr:hypothetical protein M758_7G053700 [Ceratodon purpureus]